MTAYALAHLRRAAMHDDLLDYMDRIQPTLDPFEGRFLVHGGRIDVLEGDWPGDVVITEFPATAAHPSPAREVLLVEGVPAGPPPDAEGGSASRSAEWTWARCGALGADAVPPG